LGATALKCHLLGWWADKSKGYRLEDLETKKIISLRDVKFIEDEAPTEMMIIDSNPPSAYPGLSSEDLDLDSADELAQPAQEPLHDETEPPSPSVMVKTLPEINPPSHPPAQPKGSKWVDLPPRKGSAHL